MYIVHDLLRLEEFMQRLMKIIIISQFASLYNYRSFLELSLAMNLITNEFFNM